MKHNRIANAENDFHQLVFWETAVSGWHFVCFLVLSYYLLSLQLYFNDFTSKVP